MNVELPVTGNAASRSGNWLAERVMGRRSQRRTGKGFLRLVVPEPLFARFEALHDWVAGRPPVQRGMLRRRGIAAAHVSALGAAPEVHPPAAVASHSAQPAPLGGTAALIPAVTIIHAPWLTSVAQKPGHSFIRTSYRSTSGGSPALCSARAVSP